MNFSIEKAMGDGYAVYKTKPPYPHEKALVFAGDLTSAISYVKFEFLKLEEEQARWKARMEKENRRAIEIMDADRPE